MQQLNPGCKHFNEGLIAAMAALHVLNDHGVTVLSIELGDRRPVITICSPSDASWIRGAMKSRVHSRGITRTVRAAPFRGCQLEWATSEARTREAVQA